MRTLFLPLDVDVIENIPIGLSRSDDALLWHYDGKGIYSAKSGHYRALQEMRINASSVGSADQRW